MPEETEVFNIDCENCQKVVDILDVKGRGFCSGLTRRKLKRHPKEDVISLCFVDKPGVGDQFFITPTEALSISVIMAAGYQAWAKKHGVKI